MQKKIRWHYSMPLNDIESQTPPSLLDTFPPLCYINFHGLGCGCLARPAPFLVKKYYFIMQECSID
jgi:hypothetical protein